MSGYNGFSMSNNAVTAYEEGQMPLSKWTKALIIDAIQDFYYNDEDLICNFNLNLFKKITLKAMKTNFLESGEWHHTSNRYNKTSFYNINTDKIEELNDEKINNIIEETKKAPKETIETETRNCEFLTWGGTRKYPTPTTHTEICIVIGNWAITSCGKKLITANGFRFL